MSCKKKIIICQLPAIWGAAGTLRVACHPTEATSLTQRKVIKATGAWKLVGRGCGQHIIYIQRCPQKLTTSKHHTWRIRAPAIAPSALRNLTIYRPNEGGIGLPSLHLSVLWASIYYNEVITFTLFKSVGRMISFLCRENIFSRRTAGTYDKQGWWCRLTHRQAPQGSRTPAKFD